MKTLPFPAWRTTIPIALLLLAPLAAHPDAETQLGRAWLEPDSATIRQEGDWTVQYEVGRYGVPVGGGIRIQFRNAWFADPWGTKKQPQTDDPEARDFVSAHASRDGAKLEVSIGREGVDGQHDRYERAFDITVRETPLLPGDRITVHFKNTRAPLLAETDTVGVAVDPGANQVFIPLPEFPSFTVLPGPVQKFLVLCPSQQVVGKPFPVRIVALDDWNNCATACKETIDVQLPADTQPRTVTLSEQNAGIVIMQAIVRKTGVFFITVRAPGLPHAPVFRSNPIRITAEPPEFNLYWGDLHSHSEISKDAIGRPETAFHNARDVFGLDFYTLTDHSVGDAKALGEWWEGILPREWEHTRQLVRKFYEPGRFVTLLAYEWSCPAPYGHHNVFYKSDTEYFYDLQHHRTLDELWSKLKNKDVFTIPHHTGISWRGINSPYVDWSLQKNDRLEPAVEIYSLHGSSEFFNNPMKYENYDFSPSTSNFGPYYVRDGWAAGLYLGTVSGSDNHTAQPGQPDGGLTCALAPKLTREAIFDAIQSRHTYATTGARILLDFRINKHGMGERFSPAPDQPLTIRMDVHGTDALDYVELMRCRNAKWTTAKRWEFDKDAPAATLEFQDPVEPRDTVYYCRVKQKHPYFGRDVMAWSSPIWVLSGDTKDSENKKTTD